MAGSFALLALLNACAVVSGIVNPLSAVGSVLGTVAGTVKDTVQDVTDEVSSDVTYITQPVLESTIYIASSQCSNVKKLAGVIYDVVDVDAEPDLDELTLVFRNSQVTVSYNLSTAAELIATTTGFNSSQKLYILIHGFLSDSSSDTVTDISNALFSRGDINVLALDASSLIRYMYVRSTYYVTYIGQKLGEVLVAMDKYGVDPAQVHLIGHSLGAHIAGFAGKQYYSTSGKHVGRITGCDPAGPCFANVNTTMRLNATDADFVDVIHTDAGVFGLDYTLGDVDYWPNGGSQQPNCLLDTCSHGRSWEYFAESVTNADAFPAVKCDSWADFKEGKSSDELSYMGFSSNSSASGSYCLQTGGSSPYGLGMNGTVYDDSVEGLVEKVVNLVF